MFNLKTVWGAFLWPVLILKEGGKEEISILSFAYPMTTIATTRPVMVDIFLQAVIISDFKELQKSYGKILTCCMKLKTEKAIILSGGKKRNGRQTIPFFPSYHRLPYGRSLVQCKMAEAFTKESLQSARRVAQRPHIFAQTDISHSVTV